MPLIEELPLSATRTAQPGWAYVPETTTNASSLPQIPSSSTQSGNRKRARLAQHGSGTAAASYAQTSSKQQKAIEARLKDLDRENFRDSGVSVAVPKVEGVTSSGAGGAVSTGNKKTSNVRRIQGYNRNFGHYLADEEALIAAGGGGFQGTWGAGVSTASGGKDGGQPHISAKGGVSVGGVVIGSGRGGKRKSGVGTVASRVGVGARAKGRVASSSTSTNSTAQVKEPTDQLPAVKTENDATRNLDDDNGNVSMSGTGTAITATNTDPLQHQQLSASPSSQHMPKPSPTTRPRYDPALDRDPLLRTLNTLPKPSDRVIAALLAEPPLSYTAARAVPLDTDRQTPRRWFCAVCGYWGRVRCRKCGGRCCGLMECWREHACEP